MTTDPTKETVAPVEQASVSPLGTCESSAYPAMPHIKHHSCVCWKPLPEPPKPIDAQGPESAPANFDDWWVKDGKFFDPDTDDVPWFDKRKDLAEYAWHRAREHREDKSDGN